MENAGAAIANAIKSMIKSGKVAYHRGQGKQRGARLRAARQLRIMILP